MKSLSLNYLIVCLVLLTSGCGLEESFIPGFVPSPGNPSAVEQDNSADSNQNNSNDSGEQDGSGSDGSGSGSDGSGSGSDGSGSGSGEDDDDDDDDDSNCDRDHESHKTLLCHIPPGNPNNAHELNVPPAAVPAHLAHGDTLGECP